MQARSTDEENRRGSESAPVGKKALTLTVSPQHVIMQVTTFCTALLLFHLGLVGGFFVPEELPTLLSFLYTNIPPIFKGTDSRLGVGFRVGPNADFQVQVELGPQTRTKALGPDAEQEDSGASKKRHIPKHYLDSVQEPLVMKKTPETPQGWLQVWKASIGTVSQEIDDENLVKQDVMDYDTVRHLQQLYKNQPLDDNLAR